MMKALATSSGERNLIVTTGAKPEILIPSNLDTSREHNIPDVLLEIT